jgi:hypothetical protein
MIRSRRALGLLGALLSIAVPGVAAETAYAGVACTIGDSGVTYNRAGDGARFRHLVARQGMNCSSARYVLNKWLRRAYRNGYSTQIPRHFWDGYVTWYCRKTGSIGWRCDETASDTAFTFDAYLL